MVSTRTTVFGLGVSFALGLLVSAVQATTSTETQQIMASDGNAGDRFGTAVALSGSTAIVGAPNHDPSASNAGAAYVYEVDPGSGSWTEVQKILGDGEADDAFGSAIAISGSVAIVGAPKDDAAATDAGAAYIFRYDFQSNLWEEEQKLTASDALLGSRFGSSVSLDGDVALIGAPQDSTGATDRGKAYVFRYDTAARSWSEEQVLVASDASSFDRFGSSVSIEGDAALIGAAGTSIPPEGSGAGVAYVFGFDGSTGVWTEEQRLTASDPAESGQFGSSVSLGSGVAAIGAPLSDGIQRISGTAHIFRFDSQAGTWVEEQEIVASDGSRGDRFGSSVSLSGPSLLVGAMMKNNDSLLGAGKGYLYTYCSPSQTWGDEEIFIPSDPDSNVNFGSSVSLSGVFALLGAPRTPLGSVYVYSHDTGALSGSVNAANGFVTNALYVNGRSGGIDRTVEVTEAESLEITMLRPVTGGSGRFLLHGNIGEAAPTVLPFGVGATAYPLLLSAGATPVVVANGLGLEHLVGASHYFGNPSPDPANAPVTLMYPNLPAGTRIVYQGVINDPGSNSSRGFSVTNAVIVDVVP